MTSKLDIQRELDELAAAGLPEEVNLWPRVAAGARAGAAGGPGRPALPRGLPRGRWAWAALALAALLVAGATAYAASPVISRLLSMDQQFHNADAARLGRALDLSQTLGDVTVTVQWAYADAQRVLVGYTITTADGRRFDPGEASLTTAGGAVLHGSGGYGVVGHSDLLGVSLPPGEQTAVAIFDSPAEAKQAQSLKFHFTLATAEYAYPTAAATTPAVSGSPASMTAEAQPATRLATAGPFEFDFDVPVRQ